MNISALFEKFATPPDKASDEMLAHLMDLVELAQEQYAENMALKQHLYEIAESAGALVWRKDENHRYTYANVEHVEKFFGVDSYASVVGRTDLEIIQEATRDKGYSNSFEHTCVVSDEYIKVQGERCNFYEYGWIDGQCFIMYVTKTPLYDACGDYYASTGFAQHAEFLCLGIHARIKRMLDEGGAIEIAPGVIHITDPCVGHCTVSNEDGCKEML